MATPYRVTLINPPLVHVTGDPFGDIPYMPTGVSYLAGWLRANGVDVRVLDCFGEAPRQRTRIDDRLSALGLTEEEAVARLEPCDLVGISVHAGMSHSMALRLAARIWERFPDVVLVAGGHHPSVVHEEFVGKGFNYVCIGEGEIPLLNLVRRLRQGGDPSGIEGLAHAGGVNPPAQFEHDLDRFGFAALDLLPLDNYWALGMSHAPVRGRYMVITTSRGCPYNCRFCTTPRVLGRQWRARSPRHVVDEIEQAVGRHGVEDVIIQDEVFGVTRENALGIARGIVERGLRVRLHLPSGVKVERLDEEILTALRKAGLVYMCLAPESGSPHVLERMSKPVDSEQTEAMVKCARKLGIRLGAFFVLGFEDESDEDRRLTADYVVQLTKLGVDEVSLFIWTPLPGAEAFDSERGWTRYEDLNWSPSWRAEYPALARFRKRLYARWLVTKALHHPVNLVRSAMNALTGRYELKSEMALRRLLRNWVQRG